MTVSIKKKLTIRIDAQLIKQAKEYAASNDTSVSQLVEVFFRDLAHRQRHENPHSSLVQKLSGLIPADIDIDAERETYLREKYDL